MNPRASRLLISLVAASTLAGCGGSSSTPTAITSNYTIGGTISGLTVSSVVLANGSSHCQRCGQRHQLGFPRFLYGRQQLHDNDTDPTDR